MPVARACRPFEQLATIGSVEVVIGAVTIYS
jgi:hypothetical protein